MSGTRSEAAWSDFWASGGAGPESGCLPKALERIDAAQRKVWEEAARKLPRGGRVLDLATGDGAVLGKIRRVRPDLKLIGVDSAAKLPPAGKGVTLRSGVPMEELPFPSSSFDLVTSQFGFEYGDTATIALEVARVLRKGGAFDFLIHHSGGPIVAHNQARQAGLVWAVNESGLLEKARALVKARQFASLPTPQIFRDAITDARNRFPDQSVGGEFVGAVFQTLELSRGAPPREALEVLQTLEERGRNEIARIEALCAAARSPEHILLLRSELRSASLAPEDPKLVREENGTRPFAWHLQGRR